VGIRSALLVQTQVGFVPEHQSTVPQLNMILHPVTLNWHLATSLL